LKSRHNPSNTRAVTGPRYAGHACFGQQWKKTMKQRQAMRPTRGATHNGMTWSLVVAANARDVLANNVLRSREIETANEVWIHWNGTSASRAYNRELNRCTGDVVVLAHQDVFLPDGWVDSLATCVQALSREDRDWGVAGCFGITAKGKGVGNVYSAGLGRFAGEFSAQPVRVHSLDEVLIVLNRAAALRFDRDLPGFHLYGTDICLEADKLGLKSYVLPCFVLHNSRGLSWLPFSFWRSYFYLRRKWRDRLPVVAPCTTISRSCFPVVDDVCRSLWVSAMRKKEHKARLVDPEMFYHDCLKSEVERRRALCRFF
jgi:hypothetical protein